jgi:hypothetical protein
MKGGKIANEPKKPAVSRPINVEGMGDKDANAECCNNVKHGAAPAA